MIHIRAPQNNSALLFKVADKSDPGSFATWVNFHFDRLCVARFPVFQDDGKRLHPINRCTASC